MKTALAILFALSLVMGCAMTPSMTKEEMVADEKQQWDKGLNRNSSSYIAGNITKKQYKKRMEELGAIYLQNLRYIYQGRGFHRAPQIQSWLYLPYDKNFKAARQGDADAQFALGEMYREGWYFDQPKNLVGAYMYYNIAALNGHLDAKVKMDIISKEMTPEEIAAAVRLTGGTLKDCPGMLSD
jgi:TPR repeat protein